MNYNEIAFINIVKKYYPLEIDIEFESKKAKFFRKGNDKFLAYSIIGNSETNFILYLFRSDNLNNHIDFIKDFNEKEIAFQIDDLKMLDLILDANNNVNY